ncbi:undecaprenyl-diphosphate phosphatase [Clostridium swellfunianum]|uniref:undecaprenyl-diphosphate phosphatase n=1 Tax=Clostridium swellfunianum TaxID=1367462 RepID=UPI002030C5BD|nr:undecaprenyl-diphosphate phosphatase [Clostridium swellfunianum]MCM0649145.1 undecaprenyl-diphosphate phosphatase [Clostridium swellfunianum]
MNFIELLKAIILGIVQGITEWLPVSSTGHLILVEDFIKFSLSDIFVSTFFVVIQFGSILAVIVLFFRKLNPFDAGKTDIQKQETISLWIKIIVATVPAGIVGFLFDDAIEAALYNPTTVAVMLIGYGILFIIIESWQKRPKINDLMQLSYMKAVSIGLFQMLALIPGTSRSGATIIGAVLLGTSRYIAAEFSFFMAVPIMLGASGYKLLKAGLSFTGFEWLVLCSGALTAFLVSIFAIRFLMDYIKKHDFKVFGYYRIVLGILVLGYFYFIR